MWNPDSLFVNVWRSGYSGANEEIQDRTLFQSFRLCSPCRDRHYGRRQGHTAEIAIAQSTA